MADAIKTLGFTATSVTVRLIRQPPRGEVASACRPLTTGHVVIRPTKAILRYAEADALVRPRHRKRSLTVAAKCRSVSPYAGSTVNETRRLPIIAVTCGFVAASLLIASGFGYRGGLWELRSAFAMIRWAAYLGVVTVLLSCAGIATTRPVMHALAIFIVPLCLGAAAAVIPFRWKQLAGTVPPIHDITTDTQDPPAFVAVLPLRADAKNSAVYGGDSVAVLQRAGYPDLQPLILPLPPGQAFVKALTVAERMGWAMVASDSASGRIEATATTRWFGFKDDVVIRVRPSGGGSVVDMRSVSRLGGSDVGTNASRIRGYLARLTSGQGGR